MVGVVEFPDRLEASVERQDTREKLSFSTDVTVESPGGFGVEAAAATARRMHVGSYFFCSRR